jgi:hypothetical protein
MKHSIELINAPSDETSSRLRFDGPSLTRPHCFFFSRRHLHPMRGHCPPMLLGEL